MGDFDSKFVPSRLISDSLTRKEMEKEATKALREWVNPDRLFQLDEVVSLVFVIAGVLWLFSAFIERGFPLITVDSVRGAYGLCVAFIWAGYKYSRIIFSLRLRIFLIAILYQIALATAFLLPYYGITTNLGLFTGFVQWPGGESNLLILATVRFLLIIPVLALIVFINTHLKWLRNRGLQRWNHLVRRNEEIDDHILGQKKHLEELRIHLQKWATNKVKQSELLGLLFVVMLHTAWIAPNVGNRWFGDVLILSLAFAFYIIWSYINKETPDEIVGIIQSTNTLLNAL